MFCYFFFNLYLLSEIVNFLLSLPAFILVTFVFYSRAQCFPSSSDTLIHTQTLTCTHTHSHPCTLIFKHILTHMHIDRHSYTFTYTHRNYTHSHTYNTGMLASIFACYFLFFSSFSICLWVIPFVKTFNDVINLCLFFPPQHLVIDTSVFRDSCFLCFSRPVCQ